MSFSGRPEVGLDAQVDLNVTPTEPASASGRQRRRLGKPFEAENAGVERLSGTFPVGWHRELHVVEGDYLPWRASCCHERRSYSRPVALTRK
jgi:hypothetical protein